MTLENPPEPPKLAIQFIITGDSTSIYCSSQSAATDGPHVTAGRSVPAAVHGGATCGQTVQVGRDATTAPAEGQRFKSAGGYACGSGK